MPPLPLIAANLEAEMNLDFSYTDRSIETDEFLVAWKFDGYANDSPSMILF